MSYCACLTQFFLSWVRHSRFNISGIYYSYAQANHNPSGSQPATDGLKKTPAIADMFSHTPPSPSKHPSPQQIQAHDLHNARPHPARSLSPSRQAHLRSPETQSIALQLPSGDTRAPCSSCDCCFSLHAAFGIHSEVQQHRNPLGGVTSSHACHHHASIRDHYTSQRC